MAIKIPNIKHATLNQLIEIQSNNYVGRPRRVGGKWVSIDYPPEEVDDRVYECMEKLEERGQLEAFREMRLKDKQHKAIDKILKGYREAIELGVFSNDQLTAFIELNQDAINTV